MLRTLLRPELWTPAAEDAAPPLLQAIRDTRKGQAELSEVLGERVREAVEILIRGHGEALSALVEGEPSESLTEYHGYLADVAGSRWPKLRRRRRISPGGDPGRHLSCRLPGGDAARGDPVRGVARAAAPR